MAYPRLRLDARRRDSSLTLCIQLCGGEEHWKPEVCLHRDSKVT